MRFQPDDRQHWRAWLADRHGQEKEVWLVFVKKHTGRANLSYDDAVEEAVCFGWIDGIKRSLDDDRYMHRFTPRKPGSNWSETNRRRVRRMIEAERMTAAGLAAVDAARASGRWKTERRASSSPEMPPELSSRLDRDERARTFFESLAPSYRRDYMRWIAAAKKPETRARRADEALRLLGSGEKLGTR